MMMQYGFNQILLVKFITKFYAFDLSLDLINQGIIFLGKIVSELIGSNPRIKNLKHKKMEDIITTILGQYSYRFGGIDQCLGAFGNFWVTYEQEIMKISDFLSHQQIRKIITPINDQLMKISFYQHQTKDFYQITLEQSTNRKVQFLKTILHIEEPVVTETKKKRKYTKQKKQNSSSNGSKSITSGQKTRCDLQESMRIEADEWILSPSTKISKLTQKSTKTSTLQENIELETNQPLKLKFEENMTIDEEKEDKNMFILRYDDFFPQQQIISTEFNKAVQTREKLLKSKQNVSIMTQEIDQNTAI